MMMKSMTTTTRRALCLLFWMAAAPWPGPRLRPPPMMCASAEIVFMGDGSVAAGLEASADRVWYLGAAVVAGGGTGPGAARISLDSLRVGRQGNDEYVWDMWDTKQEVTHDRFGYYGNNGEDDVDRMLQYNDDNEGTKARGGKHDSTLDVAIFRVPSGCAYGPPEYDWRDRDACDWPSVGVGATATALGPERSDDGGTASIIAAADTTTTTFYCCHSRAIEAGACADAPETRNRLILNGNFTGHHVAVPVAHSGLDWTRNVSNGTILLPEAGMWVVAFAYCDGKEYDTVVLRGEVVFESYYGYLPAELFPYMVLAIVLAGFTGVLLAWFLARMRRYEASRIRIEKVILCTIALAGVDAGLQVAGYVVWNQTGYRSYDLAAAGMAACALKSAVGRCNLLMAALGWGVTKESLQCLTAIGVVLLGAATVPLELQTDLAVIDELRNTLPQTFLGAMRVAVDASQYVVGPESLAYLIFAVWTAAALGWTMWTLWKTRQTRKLGRYVRLAAVLLVSALTAAIVAVVAQLRMRTDVRYVLLEENAGRVIFIVVLSGVAILWRPNENARLYAHYSTQLPSSPSGGDSTGNDGSIGDDSAGDECGVHGGTALEPDADSGAEERQGTLPRNDDEIRRAADPRGEIELPRVQVLRTRAQSY
jgi:Lung seven transmembrane receptor